MMGVCMCVCVCVCVKERVRGGWVVIVPPARLPACPFVCLPGIATERRLHKNTSPLGHDKEMTQYVVTRADHGRRT